MAIGELEPEYDVIVIGLGPGGEEVAERLAEAGLQVLGIEPHLVGGECPYYGCIPSKMVVRAAGTLAETRNVNVLAGTATADPDYSVVGTRIRTEATDDWDDRVAVERLERLGGHFVRAAGAFAGRDAEGRPIVAVEGKHVVARRGVVVATGTAPVIPQIPGLEELTADGLSPEGKVWTNREVLQIKQAPESLIVVGGGAVGCELAQGLARFGVHITQLEGGERILRPEEPEASEVVSAVLGREGIDIQTGVTIAAVHSTDSGIAVQLADGRSYQAERLLLAAGRRQHIPELAVDSVGLDPKAPHLTVDEHMRVTDGIYAVGDVTGRGAFTHVAVWQARVLIAHLLGEPEPYGGYEGLAWVTFTDPEVGRVGMSEQQARDKGIDVAIGYTELRASTRGWIHGPGNDGLVKLVADRASQTLVGATVVGPAGGEILGMLTLAVHAKVPLWTLATMHYAYPTLHRAILEAVRAIS
jgi:pyruvate/2-oxoglutarate dehydrogenase complex dihydrolipoamide dehydrogenase (E3) component